MCAHACVCVCESEEQENGEEVPAGALASAGHGA